MDKRSVYFFIISFIAGAALYTLYDFGLYFLYFLFGLSTLLGFLFILKKERLYFVVAVVLFALALGGMRYALSDLRINDIVLDSYLNQPVVAEGVISQEPDERESYTRLVVRIDTIFDETLEVETGMIVSVDRYPEYVYGDRISLVGTLKKPENFETDQGRIFNYVEYLAKDNVYYTIPYPDIVYIKGGEGNPLKTQLFAFKNMWLGSIERLLPDPQSSLLGGLVVGAKQSLGSELEDDFRKTGIIHIVVLSGYNVTIIAEAIMRVFAFLPVVASTLLGGVSIVFFALMTGASATIVRASIMALLVVLARATGRTSEVTYALFIAAFLMVLHNPAIVLYDPSFQLSFLATLGLIYLGPAIEKYFNTVPQRFQLKEFAVATVATQIFVLPLLLYMVGEFSVVALPVNLLVLLFIPLTMLFGFLAGIFGFVSSVLAFPFVWIVAGLLSYELWVVDVFASLPFASFTIPFFPVWFMFVCYGILAWWLYKKYKPKQTKTPD